MGFGGVLSSLSFAGERKGAAGGIFVHKECGTEMYPSVTALLCRPPLGKGPWGRGRRMTLLRCPKFLRCLTADA